MTTLPLPRSLVVLTAVFALTSAATAQEEKEAETRFATMLSNATLKGTWAPTGTAQPGQEKPDSYHIVRAVKKGTGDLWDIVTRVQRQGQTVEYPIPVTVKFAGDAAVMILNDARTADGGTWSARVLFHKQVYAGSWWSPGGKAGTVTGTITQEK